MTPLLGGLIQGGASLLGGLLQGKPKTNKAMNSSIRKTNMKNIAKANQQEVAWNKMVQQRANKAAQVPIVTTTKFGSGEKVRSAYDVKETTTYGQKVGVKSYVDVDAMMAAANKSGFNPVTFMQAGGLQAYTRTDTAYSGSDVFHKTGAETTTTSRYGKDVETVTGSNAMQAALVGLDKPAFHYYEGAVDYSTPAQPATGFGPALGNALTAGANTYLASRQQLDQNAFQQGLLQQQLLAANKAGSGRGYSLGGVPTMVSTYNQVKSSGGGSATGSGGLNYKGIPLKQPAAGWADYDAIRKQNETLAGFAEMLDAVETTAGGPGRGGFWDPKSTPQIRQYMWDVTGGDYWDDRAKKLYEAGPFSGGKPFRSQGGAKFTPLTTWTPARPRQGQ